MGNEKINLPEAKFNPDRVYAFYKQARNCLRKYNPESVLVLAIEALHKAQHGGIEVLRNYQPWNILLLIKWVLQEADSVSHRRPAAKLNDLHSVLNIIHEMEGSVRMPTEYEHHNFFMRHLAFQQFWLQQTVDGAAIARQELLFNNLPQSHTFQRDFFRLTGISCADFTFLSFALAALFLSDQKRKIVIRENLSNILDPNAPPESLNFFFSAISKDIPSLHDILIVNSELKCSIADQMILPTPLVNFPLLKAGSNYFVYFPALLFRSLENFIYRTLKKDKPVEFPTKFGPIFERYVRDCFSDANVPFVDESSLNKLLVGPGKCVDFLIVDDDCNILIDAKGVEISNLGRVAHQPEIVFRSIKASARKAIEQGMDTARRIAAADSTNIPFGKAQSFLLVITYDSLNLGSNTEFAEMFGQKVVDDLQVQFGNPLPIPIKNIFFLDVDELERLLARVYNNQTTILATLLHAQKNDSTPATHKFSFIQHLESLSPQLCRLPRLQAAFETLFNKCITRLTK